MKITIDNKTKTATIVVDLMDTLQASSTGNTESLASIRNQDTGLKHTDGRPIKLTCQVYVKTPKA